MENRKELAKSVGLKDEQVKALFEAIKEALVAGEKVSIAGFGDFNVKEVEERTGIVQLGDKKGEKWVKPAHTAPTFKYSSVVKKAVSEK